MSLQYCKYVIDELFADMSNAVKCDIKIICDKRVLWAHSLILKTVSAFVKNKLQLEMCRNDQPVEILLPHTDDFACYECASLLLKGVYAQNIGQVTETHLMHMKNLFNFFQIISIIKELICDTSLKEIPNKDCSATKSDPPITSLPTAVKESGTVKKKLRLRCTNKAQSAKMLACIECKLHCYKPADLVAHIFETKHGKSICSLCSFHADSNKQFEDHIKRHNHEKAFFCNTCDLRFQTRALWSQHLPVHSSFAPYQCPHCKKSFKWKHGLNSHLIVHTKEKKHLCDECGFSTTHAKTLRAHKLIHSGEVFRCSVAGCSHTSSRKENMKIHLRTHSKEKPFVCEICGLKFTQNKNLQRHSMIHYEEKSQQLHSCLHCPFKAIRSDNLKAHMARQHTEKPMNLELSDNFSDVMSLGDEQSVEVKEMISSENDLTVLADAASNLAPIENKVSIPIDEFNSDSIAKLRNFDNLIANPVASDDSIVEVIISGPVQYVLDLD